MIDLFSGIGGFSLAASWVWPDLEIVSFVEIDPFCQKILKKNFPGVPIHEDIKTFRGQPVELITGGPPCQATSVAAAIKGKRTGETLWPEMEKIIQMVRPKWAVVEQPAGNKNWEDKVKSDLEALGYAVTKFKRQASDCGAPHRRRRVFLVANANGKRLDSLSRLGTTFATESQSWPAPPRGTWSAARTGHCGMDDGVPHRVDRLKSLGNAIVPQVAYELMKNMKSAQ